MVEIVAEAEKAVAERKETEAKPEERIAAKAVGDAVAVADALSSDGVVRSIGELKSTIARTLTQLSDRLEEEIGKYSQICRAIAAKESELKEIYEIQRSASTLLAFLETQQRKQEEMQREFQTEKEQLEREIETTRAEWEKEKTTARTRDQGARRRGTETPPARTGRVQVHFRAGTAACTRSVGRRTGEGPKGVAGTADATGREWGQREKALAASEQELAELRARAAGFAQRVAGGGRAGGGRGHAAGRAAAPSGRGIAPPRSWKGRRTSWPRRSPPWSAPCKSKPSSLPGSNSRPKKHTPRCRKSPCGPSKVRPAQSNWPTFSSSLPNRSARAVRPSDDGDGSAVPRWFAEIAATHSR